MVWIEQTSERENWEPIQYTLEGNQQNTSLEMGGVLSMG